MEILYILNKATTYLSYHEVTLPEDAVYARMMLRKQVIDSGKSEEELYADIFEVFENMAKSVKLTRKSEEMPYLT